MEIKRIESIKPYTMQQVSFKKSTNHSENVTHQNKKLLGYSLGVVLLAGLGVVSIRTINKNIKAKKTQELLNDLTNTVLLNNKTEGVNRLTSNSLLKKKLIDRIFMPLGLVTLKGDKELIIKNALPNGIILFGPKNSQKDFIADIIGEHAQKLGMDFIKPKHLAGNSLETVRNISNVFKSTEASFDNNPKYTFVLLDKMDSYAKDRRVTLDNLKEVSALLKLTENSSKRGVIWVGVADDITTIDKALLDRATLIAPIEPPKGASQDVIKKYNEDLAYAREEGFIASNFPDFHVET